MYTQRTTLWAAGLLALALASLSPHEAQAQTGKIRLFSTAKTYTPGKTLTVYVYFYQVSALGMWGQHIQSNRDFRVLKSQRMSRRYQVQPDPDGFDMGERLYHLFYRVQLKPRRSAQTLRFGPIQMVFQVGTMMGMRTVRLRSNVLTFRKKAPSSSTPKGRILPSIEAPKTPIFAGSPFKLTYKVKCPQRLCDFRKIGQDRVLRLLQGKVQLDPHPTLQMSQSSVRPTFHYSPKTAKQAASVELRFGFKFFPSKAGTLNTPSFRMELPTLTVLDQQPALEQAYRWLRKLGVPANRVRSYIQVRSRYHAQVDFRKLRFRRRSLTIQKSRGLMGSWSISSDYVGRDGQKQWRFSLEGKGFLPTVIQAFQEKLKELLQLPALKGKLKLADLAWEALDAKVDGRLRLRAYFSMGPSKLPIPAIQMRFVNDKGEMYQRGTKPLAASQAEVSDSTPSQASAKSRRLYIHHYKAPAVDAPQPVSVWGVDLPAGFPLRSFLTQRWKLHSPLKTQLQQVGTINVRQRRQFRTPFGIQTSIYIGPKGIKAKVAQLQASVRAGALARFPRVRWGQQWLFHHRKASKSSQAGLRLEARTDRKRYFASEAVNYTLSIFCSSSSCAEADTRKFIKEQLFGKLKMLKIPSFNHFSGVRIQDRLKLFDRGAKGYEYRYTVRFRAPRSDRLQIKPVTLRLPYRILRYLYYKHQACFFPEGGAHALLFAQLVRDHHDRIVRSQGACGLGTQILTSSAISLPIDPLPDQARQLQLIGSFRLNTSLSRMSFPNKNTTIADKPFYLTVEIAGDGDLSTARDLLRDQLASIGRSLRKRSVTTYIETPDDAALLKQGKIRLQMQIIAEEAGKFTLPSLKLKHYHREEGVLTAQTLPIAVTIVARKGGGPSIRKRPLASTRSKRTLQQSTDLKPNLVLGTQGLANQHFSLRSWQALLSLFAAPLLFVLFLGWHRVQLHHQADPQRAQRNKALRQCSAALKEASFDDPKAGARACIDALQSYLIQRLSLSQKQLTASEIEELLQEQSKGQAEAATQALIAQLQDLEASLYGGDAIEDPRAFLEKLEQQVSALDRVLPKSGVRS